MPPGLPQAIFAQNQQQDPDPEADEEPNDAVFITTEYEPANSPAQGGQDERRCKNAFRFRRRRRGGLRPVEKLREILTRAVPTALAAGNVAVALAAVDPIVI